MKTSPPLIYIETEFTDLSQMAEFIEHPGGYMTSEQPTK